MPFSRARGLRVLLRTSVIVATALLYLFMDTPLDLATAAPAKPASFLVTINVDEAGYAKVTMNFTSSGTTEFSTYLPVFQNLTLREIGGHYSVERSEVAGYFYNKTYFKQSSDGVASLLIEYDFPYASIYSGDTAWFMSPMLGNDAADVQVVVELTNFAVFLGYYPTPSSVEGSRASFVMPSSSEGQRVAIDYRLARPATDVNFTRDVRNALVVVRSASIYESFVKQIFETFERSYDNLSYVFGTVAPRVEFQFYLPKELDIGALGYVRGEDVQIGKGPINVNLALIRFKPGYLEQVVLHEYVHLALGEVGVEAKDDLRWFHEGVAEYISGEICKALGIDTDVDEHLVNYENYVKTYGNDISFVEDWEDEPLYYSLAYAVVRKLGDDLGGLAFYRSTFYEIKRRGGVSDLQGIVDVMSAVAGRDLSGLFRGWGFKVQGVETEIVPLLVDAMPIIVTWMALMAISVVLARRL